MRIFIAATDFPLSFVAPALAQTSTPTSASAYVPAAGASDLYEKTSSEIVLKVAKSAEVRRYAQMMISDHGKTTAQVTAAAKASGMTVLPPKLMPNQAKMIADLSAAPASGREKMYLTQQLAAHRVALALHQGYAKSGDQPALKKVAATEVPIVQKHLTEVEVMATAMQ